jgi:ElaB/YqjD/DUF883 family membrane-anchored ribosome-binding protein
VTVKKSPPASKSKAQAALTASQAWQEVLARMSDLGDAMAQWTKVAAHEAGTKKKLDQVRAGVDDMAKKANATLGHAESEFGQQMKEGAEQAGQAFGDATQRMRDATEPHVKMAFAELSDAFGKAAAMMGEAKPAPSKAATPRAKPKTAPKKK